MESYAELFLYHGFCHSYGIKGSISEGEFRGLDKKNEVLTKRYFNAMDCVKFYIRNNMIILGHRHFVNNSEEGEKLVNFSEESIKGGKGLIELINCYHGRISFKRKIIFEGWMEDEKNELIEKLKISGITPNSNFLTERELIKYSLNKGGCDIWNSAIIFN